MVHKLGLKNEYLYNRSKKLFFLNEKQIHRGKDISDFSTVEIQMETSHQLLLFLRLLQSSSLLEEKIKKLIKLKN